MDPSWGFIGNPVPRNSISPVKGAMDPRVGAGIDPLTGRPNTCGPEVPYHTIYQGECNYINNPPEEPVKAWKPQTKLVNASLEGTADADIGSLYGTSPITPPLKSKDDVQYDLKNALFQTIDSANETERPVQVINMQNKPKDVQVVDVKENMTDGTLPWWKDPVELINFKAVFDEQPENRTYNEETNYYSQIALLVVLGTLIITGLFTLNIIIFIAIIGFIAVIFIRGETNEVNNKEGGMEFTNPVERLSAPAQVEGYCETPAGVIDQLAPKTLRKERPDLYRSVNQNFWNQADRRPIKKVCPTTPEHGEAIKYIYGDTIKRHIFY